jgi:hypothetical protein
LIVVQAVGSMPAMARLTAELIRMVIETCAPAVRAAATRAWE